ncbi:MAG: TetR/AcrR family transcriptional regulator [Clostridia bacterium]|nr:TetR/AcrR family transcriptional regulator [Clostridia bacterium]
MDGLIYDSISEEIIALAERIATESGTKDINVRRIIKELNVTNRVFYNRFHNIDEVLEIVYTRAAQNMHESFSSTKDINTDFFGYVTDVCVNVLLNTYDIKNRFSQYMFEFDSYTASNFAWWKDKIEQLIDFGKKEGKIKDVDSNMLSYSLWCFLRGFNADAVNRGLSKDEAIKKLTFGLSCLFEGIKK